MYDINFKNLKKQKGFYAIFLFAGLFFFIIMGGIIFSSFAKEKQMDASVMSSRVEIRESSSSDGTMYSPVYYYTVDGKEYACTSTTSSNIYPSEENKLVKYNSKAPGSCVSEYDKNSNVIFIIFMLLPIIFIAVGLINILKVNKRIKQIKALNNTGKLIKGLPYRMENTGAKVNDVPIQRPVVDYVLPNGTTISLQGDPRHDRKHFDGDGMVDLLVDENDPTNYFIDFEINRLSGNLPTDYYVNPNSQMPQQQMMYNQQGAMMQPGYGQMPQQPMYNAQYPNGEMTQQPMYNTQYPNGQMPQQPMYDAQYPNQNNQQ